jgi:hypothetical protein
MLGYKLHRIVHIVERFIQIKAGVPEKVYVHTLKEHRFFQCMSRKGNCHDNAVMENFFGIMKQDMFQGEVLI